MRIARLHLSGVRYPQIAFVDLTTLITTTNDGVCTFDLTRDNTLIARMAGEHFALGGDRIITLAGDTLRVHDRGGNVISTQQSPEQASRLITSANGRYVYLRSRTGVLLDTTDSRRVWSQTYASGSTGHASFTRWPDGRDVLFVSAPSYLDVTAIDCASGAILYRMNAATNWSFCHTDYALNQAGTRLSTFGCVWGAPYAARLYDAADLNGENTKTPRLLFDRSDEPCNAGDAFGPLHGPAEDGFMTFVSHVQTKHLPAKGSEDDVDWRADKDARECALLDELLAATTPGVVVVTRVDPESGAIVDHFVHSSDHQEREDLLPLREHRVLVVGERVSIVDAKERRVHDIGAAPARAGSRRLAVNADETLLVIVD